MKYNLDKYNEEKLKKLFDNNDRNIDVSEFYNAYIHNDKKIFDKKILDKIINDSNISEEQAFYYSILGLLEVDYDDPYILEMCFNNKIDVIKKLDIIDYESNPYYRNIKPFKTQNKDVELCLRDYKKYEGFIYQDVSFDKKFNEVTSLGYFDREFKYLTLSKKKQIWMSITPHEINTMKKSIQECSGNCVVLGLGLGYYPYMISLKEDVKSITIIEKDRSIIEIFNKYILPQFEHKEKIKIIETDGFEYVKNMECDYCFIDLWHDEIDGLPMYEKFLKLEKENIRYSYWIEDSFIAIVRRCLINLLNEQYFTFTNAKYDKEYNYFDHIINRVYLLTKDKVFDSFDEIIDFVSKENIKELLKSI